MVTNVGSRDRLFRTIFGVFGMLLGFLFIQGFVGNAIGIVGLVSLVTGVVGWCGIYALLGRSTVGADEARDPNAADREHHA